jgi:hypothetical protein
MIGNMSLSRAAQQKQDGLATAFVCRRGLAMRVPIALLQNRRHVRLCDPSLFR